MSCLKSPDYKRCKKIRAQKVLEKCGFVKEAVFKKSIFKDNTLNDEIRYAKIRTERLP